MFTRLRQYANVTGTGRTDGWTLHGQTPQDSKGRACSLAYTALVGPTCSVLIAYIR